MSLDLSELTSFIINCKKHDVDSIEISTTENVHKHFDNFYYKANIHNYSKASASLMGAIMERKEEKIKHLEKLVKQYRDIHLEINSYMNQIKVRCYNEIDSLIKMEIVYENIIKYSNVKDVKCYFKGEEINDTYDFVELIQNAKKKEQDYFIDNIKYDNDIYSKIKEIVLKDEVMLRVKKWELKNKITNIENKIKSNKNSYIMNGLITGGLNKDEVQKYPELIKAVDDLKKLYILTH
jgi:hypothetical protein